MKAREWGKASECATYLYNDYHDYESVLKLRKRATNRFTYEKDESALNCVRSTYFLTARDIFDDYMIAMEWERPLKSKFYIPRRSKLLPIVNQMQRLADDELDILGVNAPPGIGKTALGDFFMTFTEGRFPQESTLMGSHSKAILTDNYNECLRELTSDEYCWKEIFKGHDVVKTNALDMKIDIDTPRKFSSLQFASMGSGLAGRLRCTKLLYLDDLVPNLETALNAEQLEKIYRSMVTDYLQRMQGDDTKLLFIMTNWSVNDPSERLKQANEGNERAYFLKMQALNSKDESNFDYGGTIGFSTKFYHKLRDTLDPMEWNALYMSNPIEREGLLFHPDELRYYYDLPSDEPDAVIAVCDTKDSGTDDCVLPVAYKYGEDYYIEDFLCDDDTPDKTTPRIIDKLKQHKVKMCRFESNSAGGRIADDVAKLIKENNGITSVSKKYSTANKETRIIANSGWVKQHCVFKDKTTWTQEYAKAMRLLTTFSKVSKKKKDDVPDAMSMLADFSQSFETNVLTVRQRIF